MTKVLLVEDDPRIARFLKRGLEAEGYSVGHAHVRVLAPLPVVELKERMAKAKHVIVVESNQQGQLAQLIEYRVNKALREEGAPVPAFHSLVKYDGTPFLPEEILAEAKEVTSYAQTG